jgi:hypothetical protein
MCKYTVTCRFQWPRCQRRGFAASRLLGLWVRIPPGAWMSVSCECCELSSRGLCVGQRSPTECDVSECDREASIMWRPCPTGGCCDIGKSKDAVNSRAVYMPLLVYEVYCNVVYGQCKRINNPEWSMFRPVAQSLYRLSYPDS